jgi:hypothetical protein
MERARLFQPNLARLGMDTDNKRPKRVLGGHAQECKQMKNKTSIPNAKPFMKFVSTFTELRQQIHNDLRIQHPEWVQPNGESHMCDSYESRLVELLDNLTRRGSNESIAATHRVLEQGLN